jgi:hypothetical protein
MFTKLKVTQSMVDAVNKVLDEASAPIKEPTSTGMKVYGRSYGNSAKAKQDQSKSSVDDLKGPKTKDLMKKDKEDYLKTKGKYDEAAKPDYLDFDKDGNKAEPMKKALGDKKKVAEELKGDQHKIDANKNNKVDAHDFAILRAKKKVKESFSVRLEEKWKSMKEKKDVVMPEALEKSPEKNQDVADKSHLKDKPGSFKSDLKNLGRFLTGKKETNEEVEQVEEVKKPTGELKDACWKGYTAVGMKMKGGRKVPNCVPEEVEEYTEDQLDEMINEVLGKDATAGDWISDFIHSNNPKFAGKSKAKRKEMALAAYYGKQRNEEVIAEAEGLEVKKEYDDKKEAEHGVYHKGKKIGYIVHHKKSGTHTAYHSPQDDDDYGQIDDFHSHHDAVSQIRHSAGVGVHEDVEIAEVTIAGTSGWKKIPKDVKDKSGAIHTPMSRAKNLAHSAFKKVQDRTKISKQD